MIENFAVAFAVGGAIAGAVVALACDRVVRHAEARWRLDAAAMLEDGEAYRHMTGLDLPPELGPAAAALRRDAGVVIRPRDDRLAAGASRSTVALAGIAGAIISLAMAWRAGAPTQAIIWCGFCWALLAAAAIDLRSMWLPEWLTQSLLWAGLSAATLGLTGAHDAISAVAGATAGYVGLWALASGYGLIARCEAMGQGDYKLMAAIGAWLGPMAILVVAIGAFASASAVGLALRRVTPSATRIPFGPHLALSAMAVAMMGSEQAVALLIW